MSTSESRLHPGAIMGAAIDWMLVLTATGVAAQYAMLLWSAYDRFIASKKTGKDNAGIVISLERGGAGLATCFGSAIPTRIATHSLRTFGRKVETIRQTNAHGESMEHVVDETRWRRST